MPGHDGPGIRLEHVHRYAIAAALVDGGVLDVGCGVGYGAHMLARRARSVAALDLSPDVVHFALEHYGAPGVSYFAGDARILPFADGSFDWAVCFELLEHMVEGEALIDEIRRVLKPDGRLLLSTPNRPVYSEASGYSNPFHLREYDRDELRSLLSGRFETVELLGQRLVAGSLTWRVDAPAGERRLVALPPEDAAGGGATEWPEPRYLLVRCGALASPASKAAEPQSLLPGDLEALLDEQEGRQREGEARTRARYEEVIEQLRDQLLEFDGRIRQIGAEMEAHAESSRKQIEALALERDLLAERCRDLESDAGAAGGVTPQDGAVRDREAIERLSGQLQDSLGRVDELAVLLENRQREARQELTRLLEERDSERLARIEGEARLAAVLAENEQRLEEIERLTIEVARLQDVTSHLRATLSAASAENEVLLGRATGEGELVERIERLTRDLDWSYHHWKEREAELAAIHGSKMWRAWLSYHYARRRLFSPLSGSVALAATLRGWVLNVLGLPARLLALPYLVAWTAVEWAKGAWRARSVPPSPPRPAADAEGLQPPRRPRVLVVCPYPLFPADHGGGVRISNLVRRLAGDCEIHLLLFSQSGDDPVQRAALSPPVEEVYFHHWRPTMRGDLWGLEPRGAQLFGSPEVQERVREILSTRNIDILQLEYTELGQYGLPQYGRVKVVLTEIDITFRSRARRRRAGMHHRYKLDLLFGYSHLHWMRQFRYEVQVARRVDQIHVMSEADGAYLARFLPDAWRTIRVVPNAVDLSHFRVSSDEVREPRRLLFLGNFEHLPNLDALDYLVEEVWPEVRRAVPDAQLWVVGARAGRSVLRRHGRDGVEVIGAVPDPLPYYRRCRALVAPIRAGSGTRLKILEAMACGTPVVSTCLGAEGIAGVDGEHFLLADKTAAFAEAICRLLEDDELCARLGAAARVLIEARYGWEASAAKALAGYRGLLPTGTPADGEGRPAAASGSTPRPRQGSTPEEGDDVGAVDVSVILPTRNGGDVLDRCLAAVRSQRTDRSVEIVCVDSGSPPGGLDAMRRHGARVVEIDPADFNHGLTRDLGAERSRGRVLVFLNQDAVPRDEQWLTRLTEPLFADDRWVAVQGGIVEVMNPEERFYWDSCGPRFYFTRESRHWLETYFGIGFSTVNAAIRRDAWERHRFGEAQIMEDKKWQQEVVAAGGAIATAPEALVEHTHRYPMRALIRRCESEGFGWRTLGERYRLRDMLLDMVRPGVYLDLLQGLVRGRVRTWPELAFPWLRPMMLYRGNRWGKAAKL